MVPGFHQFHFLAAAYQRRAAAVQYLDDVAAMHALVHFMLIGHGYWPPLNIVRLLKSVRMKIVRRLSLTSP